MRFHILVLGCYAHFCWPCFLCSLAGSLNESKLGVCCFGNSMLPMYRMKVRTTFKIQVKSLFYHLVFRLSSSIYLIRVMHVMTCVLQRVVHSALVFNYVTNWQVVTLHRSNIIFVDNLFASHSIVFFLSLLSYKIKDRKNEKENFIEYE